MLLTVKGARFSLVSGFPGSIGLCLEHTASACLLDTFSVFHNIDFRPCAPIPISPRTVYLSKDI